MAIQELAKRNLFYNNRNLIVPVSGPCCNASENRNFQYLFPLEGISFKFWEYFKFNKFAYCAFLKVLTIVRRVKMMKLWEEQEKNGRKQNGRIAHIYLWPESKHSQIETIPAPTTVCISSINRMICPFEALTSFRTAFNLSSKSPRYLAPASNEPISSEINCTTRPTSIIMMEHHHEKLQTTKGQKMHTGMYSNNRR